MHIAIDARAYSWTGIGRYIRNLVIELICLREENLHISLLLAKEDIGRCLQHIESKAGKELVEKYITVVPVEGSYYTWREQVIFLRQLNAIKADLFHFTHFNVPVFFRKPYVVTIHDITRFIFPGQKKQSLIQQVAYEYIFFNAVKHAKKIIAVSQTTKNDLLQLEALHVKEEACHVIYEGVEVDLPATDTTLDKQKIRMLLGGTFPYILFVGVWMNHKNLKRLLQAFAKIKQKNHTLRLVLTGKPKPGYVDIIGLARGLHIEKSIIFTDFVPHALLGALYAEAEAFLFISLYEGFGLPPLEAAYMGTPVIASNVSSIPEIMGNAAFYVNPEDVSDIAAGIDTVLEKSQVIRSLKATGKRQAAKYSWQKTALKTLSVYEEIGAQIS